MSSSSSVDVVFIIKLVVGEWEILMSYKSCSASLREWGSPKTLTASSSVFVQGTKVVDTWEVNLLTLPDWEVKLLTPAAGADTKLELKLLTAARIWEVKLMTRRTVEPTPNRLQLVSSITNASIPRTTDSGSPLTRRLQSTRIVGTLNPQDELTLRCE